MSPSHPDASGTNHSWMNSRQQNSPFLSADQHPQTGEFAIGTPQSQQNLTTMEDVENAILQAKNAACALGIEDPGVHSYSTLPEDQPKISMGFHLLNLESAVQLGKIQKVLNTLPGVQATVILDTKMAWLTAPDSLTPTDVVDLLKEHGVKAWPTNATLLQRHDDARERSSRAHKLEQTLERQEKRRQHQGIRQRRRADPPVQSRVEQEAGVLFTDRSLLKIPRLVVALIFGVPVIVMTLLTTLQFDYWQWVAMFLTIPVVTYSAWPFHKAFIVGLKYKLWALDSASALAISLSFFYSAISLVFTNRGDVGWHTQPSFLTWHYETQGSGALFFDVACGVTILLLIGRQMNRVTALRSRIQLNQLAILPSDTVEVYRRDNGTTRRFTIPICELRANEDILIRPGETIPVDGVVIGGKSSIDMGPVGGNRRNVEVKVNDLVYAGGRNLGKDLKIRVVKYGSQTLLSAMHGWVKNSLTEENRSAFISTRGASIIVNWAYAAALIMYVLWWFITGSTDKAISAALAILAAVAPMSLAVAIPLATVLALGRAAGQGVLIKGPKTLNRMGTVDTVIFNRNGTLTKMPVHVVAVIPMAGESDQLVLRVASALSMESLHEVNQAVVRADRSSRDGDAPTTIARLEAEAVEVSEAGVFSGVITIPGHNGEPPRTIQASLWRPQSMSEIHSPELATAVLSGGTPLVVSWDGKARGVITIADTVKQDAVDAVADLEDAGIFTAMITRDAYPVARRTADYLGINTVLAGIIPSQKPHAVREIQALGANVACVGGMDMQESLAVANVGMLMGVHEHFDQVQADVVLIRKDVSAIGQTLQFCDSVRKIVYGNLVFSWVYNVLAMVLAASGVLHPLVATIAMLGSSLIVERRCSTILDMGFVDSHEAVKTHTQL